MASNYTAMIKKLQMAINMYGYRLLYSTSEFYSVQFGRPIIMYYIKYADINEQGQINNVLLFRSASQLRIVFFMRDMWNMIQQDPHADIDQLAQQASLLQEGYLTKHDYIKGTVK